MSSKFDLAEMKRLYLGGTSYRKIAKELGCSLGTVQTHIKKFKEERAALPADKESRVPVDTRIQVLNSIELGANYTVAARLAGIHPNTLAQWRKEPEFDAAIQKARAVHAQKNLERIDRAAENDWKAADRLLGINELTKDDFSQEKTPNAGVSITINIPRPGDLEQKWADEPIIDITPED